MYRGKRYRIGNSAAKKPEMSTTSTASISTNLSSISTATKPPVTSTPNESRAGPSNVLTERASNLPSSSQLASQSTATTQKGVVIISNDDDFMIPPSQVMPPSRYISQRSARLKSQLSYNTQYTPMSYFENVLNRCGVLLTARNSDVSYTLNCDHLKFVIRLRRELTSHPKYPENVQTFLSGLVDNMKNQTQLVKILSGCMVNLLCFWNFDRIFKC